MDNLDKIKAALKRLDTLRVMAAEALKDDRPLALNTIADQMIDDATNILNATEDEANVDLSG